MPDRKLDRLQAARWAYELTQRQTWCILDAETTGLGNEDQICQIAVVDPQGQPLINTLVRPTIPISGEAQAIHGITNEMVQYAGYFPEVFMELWKAIGDREIVIYNTAFDLRLIRQSLKAWGFGLWLQGRDHCIVPGIYQSIPPTIRLCPIWLNGAPIQCAMHLYAQWVGDWSDYHHDYRWQKLPGGNHTALGDCRAVLDLIQRMAATYKEELKAEPSEPPTENSGATLAEMPTIAGSSGETGYDDIPF